MEITVTELAQSEIEQQLQIHQLQHLKLVYDNEGCGCAVNGVPQLWMIAPVESSDSWPSANGSSLQIFYAQKDAVFFEERMTIDYQAAKRSFILKSNNQIYNANMSLIAK
ncbi:MAG: iron-sulfur cluster biosynthesis protein [Bacilli bacterium]|nr:iron-sulfur cluster biosynthesis protein [Bacilli bacterium]